MKLLSLSFLFALFPTVLSQLPDPGPSTPGDPTPPSPTSPGPGGPTPPTCPSPSPPSGGGGPENEDNQDLEVEGGDRFLGQPETAHCHDDDGGGSCMSGNTGLILVEEGGNHHDEKNLRHGKVTTKNRNQVKKLTELKVGDKIKGLDHMMEPSTCTVEAIGEFGFGELHGNYTDDHFILNPSTGMIEEHGVSPSDAVTNEQKYEILTDCPLGIDESGTMFTPIDSDFCGKHLGEMAWSDYVLLHKGILRIVRATGGFWFSMSSYPDFEVVTTHAPPLCASMLKCMKDHEDCEEFEKHSIVFIDNALSESTRDIAKGVFTNIGRHRELGSAAASLSDGKSVKAN